MTENRHKWRETENLLNYLVNTDSGILTSEVIITEKLDGANISIGFLEDRVRITSRNLILIEFSFEMMETTELPVFNRHKLNVLKPYIIKLKDLLPKIKEFEENVKGQKWVYYTGELYWKSLDSLQWIPFGFIREKDDGKESIIMLKEHRSYFEDFILPDIIYEGILNQGLFVIDEWMKTNKHEGVIIIFNKSFCLKYKAPKFEEQTKEFSVALDSDPAILLVYKMYELSRANHKIKPSKIIKTKIKLPYQDAFRLLKQPESVNKIIEHIGTHMPISKDLSEQERKIFYASIYNELDQEFGLKDIDSGIKNKLLDQIKISTSDYFVAK